MQGEISIFEEESTKSLRVLTAIPSLCDLQVISPIFNKLAEDEKYKDNALFVTVRLCPGLLAVRAMC